MNQLASLSLIVVGAILLVLGLASADSLSSRLSSFFTGHPTDKTAWLLIGGAAALVVGVFAEMRSHKA